MQEFHNLRGGSQVPHTFYELAGSTRVNVLSLRNELGARWNIVESSFTMGIGRSLIAEGVAVDHVFPYVLMERFGGLGGWQGPDLDAVWNLAPAHAICNGAKSDRLPRSEELRRLADRNRAIMLSPYPLKKTLALNLKSAGFGDARPEDWPYFLRAVQDLVVS